MTTVPQDIRGTTRLLGVMGWPVTHTLSPAMQSAAIRAAKLDLAYLPLSVPPDRLEAAVRGLAALGFIGANVTIPHKERVAALMDTLTPEAGDCGAVNTIRVEPDGRLTGHNTDIAGVLEALREGLGTSPKGATVSILGCGGAGRAAAFACAQAGAEKVFLLNRDEERARRLARDLSRRHPGVRAEAEPWGSRQPLRLSGIVLQMTSLGMAEGDALPVEPEWLAPGAVLLDAVVRRNGTPLVRAAAGLGHRAIGGLAMLVAQGAASFQFWTGMTADRAAMTDALRAGIERDSSPAPHGGN